MKKVRNPLADLLLKCGDKKPESMSLEDLLYLLETERNRITYNKINKNKQDE
tara:strand:- start:4113 stop:4268 length:156 start_codon:yes stop_codon:yes gene_type:complete